ncbi:MAG TPA: methylmalonyl Co-A mutase-associated GTPase MeaB [Kosmotoga arenicorallina]|uniref:Methylmalonyl Co-A mutase-associated GTPase MeaB n=1 Tax=Kosmotoga arenicorallina TaxID=688066 RepID=A0A7C5DWM1_9BACT|nr:methylmalonyl Co-A mutase-associated GTPase MeaB [Kosmotoga arenicorallina]
MTELSLEKLKAEDVKEISKALTIIENDPIEAKKIVGALDEKDYCVIGLTGSPGSGKSTLTDRLASLFSLKEKIGIIAVDPSSPFTGGAFLGDRIRMKRTSRNDNVYIRSMASRGKLGGLSPSIYDAVELLGRCGFKKVFVETVGAGQSETDIANLADIVLLVLAPGLGDEIQMLKAGIMEIGDIYVVNKMDIEGASRLKSRIEAVLDFSNHRKDVILTDGIKGTNLEELARLIEKELQFLKESGKIDEKRKKRKRFNKLNTVFQELKELPDEAIDRLVEELKKLTGGR